ncbi:UDP-N-acetylglucosamine 2-epimerase (non-hydrolyzing) [bacterium]|nr:UDP-N-acetylglucosamine 2-epimerase (non-hydrolyzing) [bacterium]RQV92203.1 MAG: UDP-N-acetylglucosamine 2-epimerase (non-hydrolyzing) [bacterium]
MKTLSVVGTRPQFIKAAVVSRVLKNILHHTLVHTGQHYDNGMSYIFFNDLGISRPDCDLGVGSGSHGVQTGLILERLEKVLVEQKPDLVLVYGDTNSTLAGMLSAVKLNIPVGHVEAGLRSYNRNMPEEINRLLTDHGSDFYFCPTQTAVDNLRKEGIMQDVHLTGDVMFDAVLRFANDSEKYATVLSDLKVEKKDYHLCTLHRAENTDCKDHLKTIVEALVESRELIVFPIHPRTKKSLQAYGLMETLKEAKNIIMSEPVGFLDMIQLEKNARKILTDSGGVQKEAYFYQVPCITFREETEWIETVQDSWNILVGADKEKILQAIHAFAPHSKQRTLFGNGNAGEQIRDIIQARFL